MKIRLVVSCCHGIPVGGFSITQVGAAISRRGAADSASVGVTARHGAGTKGFQGGAGVRVKSGGVRPPRGSPACSTAPIRTWALFPVGGAFFPAILHISYDGDVDPQNRRLPANSGRWAPLKCPWRHHRHRQTTTAIDREAV